MRDIEGLLNAKCWDSAGPKELGDLLRREEVDNRQEKKE